MAYTGERAVSENIYTALQYTSTLLSKLTWECTLLNLCCWRKWWTNNDKTCEWNKI